MTKLTEDLRELGLGKHEARVYLALQELEKSKAGTIIKKTGLHRNIVYTALKTLTDQRLASKTTTGSVALFQATDPIHLLDLVHEQELTAQKVIETLQSNKRVAKQEITVYEDNSGVRAFSLKNASELQPGETICVLGSGGERFQDMMGPAAMKKYFSLIDKQQGHIKILTYRGQRYDQTFLSSLQRRANVEIRELPIDLPTAATTVFTPRSVAIHLYAHPVSVIDIKNPYLVEAYEQYFQLLWNQEIRVTHGDEALREAFMEMIDELRPGESYDVLGTNVGMQHKRLEHMFDEVHAYRIKKGVVANLLAYKDAAEVIETRSRRMGDPELKISHIKTLLVSPLTPMQVNLFNGKTMMVLYEPTPSVIYFDRPEVYHGFKSYFDELWSQHTLTLTGRKGIERLCEMVLEEGKDLYLIGANGVLLKSRPDYYKQFTQRRKERFIPLHILAVESVRGTPFAKLPFSDIHYLPEGFESPMVVWVFGDYVAHALWHEPETVFLIHDKQTASYYRQYFDALKKMAS